MFKILLIQILKMNLNKNNVEFDKKLNNIVSYFKNCRLTFSRNKIVKYTYKTPIGMSPRSSETQKFLESISRSLLIAEVPILLYELWS